MKSLLDPVTVLKGVGQAKADLLAKLNITTIQDLLYHFPFRYQDISVKDLHQLVDGQEATLAGIVRTEPVVQYYGGKKSRLSVRLAVGPDLVQVTIFNQPYLKKNFVIGESVYVYGKYEAGRQQLLAYRVFNHHQEDDQMAAIYPTTAKLSQKTIQDLVTQALVGYQDLIPEILPQAISDHYQLMGHRQAVGQVHFPDSEAASLQARRQIKYQEFFLYQLGLQWRRLSQRQHELGAQIRYNNQELIAFIQTIPFELTSDQKKVVNEICADLRQTYPMNRLLQGDVGSGKTIVATIAIYATAIAGYQSALMVPTEILADQHFQSIQAIFDQTPVQVALLTGSTKAKDRRQILAGLAEGSIHVVVGTHALIQDDVAFRRLGLAIIDEQHRFGVNQRAALRQKSQEEAANLLYMTATPIPRTLEITIMGDMDVSKIKALPSGRQPIQTLWVRPSQADRVQDQVWGQLKAGHQVYIICPLIQESESLEVQNAENIYQDYQAQYGDYFGVGLLHGKMTNEEKDQVMADFQANRCQILVATTVVEVGVNVPNATFMVILDADRFGLAQLHQLRGRIGRGAWASTCVLIADPKTENGKQRMQIMTQSTDGFYLSQQDLELRGAGDYFGTKQSGLPRFKLADPIGDQVMLGYARRDAGQVARDMQANPQLYPQLQAWLSQQAKNFNQ
ncbi:ATP-dependent DNA helicase RecG [Aerococcus urinaehominis]|uniref:ATP-dependent DNA helicase RecG n=1 Tax=Aerococcus urinaehominis TaxID=128944 RepID=A0A109RHK0_9LACT|nr:ATP-dependent DNA helicase RecG [Aerococcus urinaehominis]AMB98966.1 ATP-dependent DNA helicase RecG [Aerococcus urinaehominis]SDM37122.1 ATP-dependent DNA helicase RecG [Aerococcus urinaehominis]